MDVYEWLVKWFAENGDVTEEMLRNNPEENYFVAGYIDSFGFIALMSAVEETFHIQFTNEEFANPAISTIHGLTELLRKKANGNG